MSLNPVVIVQSTSYRILQHVQQFETAQQQRSQAAPSANADTKRIEDRIGFREGLARMEWLRQQQEMRGRDGP
jgi:hypothetical protein